MFIRGTETFLGRKGVKTACCTLNERSGIAWLWLETSKLKLMRGIPRGGGAFYAMRRIMKLNDR